MDFFDILLAKKLEDDRDPKVEGLSVTANGTYSEDGVVYKPVVVNVPETPLSSLAVTANGTYTAPSGTAYNEVDVNVPLPENAYLLEEYEDVPTDIASFTASDAPLKSLTASIVPVQAGSGDPSPTNVRPISGWNKSTISDVGDNWGDCADIAEPKTTNTWYTVNLPYNTYTISFDAVNVERGQTGNTSLFSINGSNNILADRIYSVDDGATYQSKGANVSGRFYFTFTGKFSSLGCYWRSNTYQFLTSGSLENIMIEVGNNPTKQYTPYNGRTTTIPFTDGQGQSVEVFGGSVDVVNGVVTPYPYYASYNGEQLTGEWISDRDVYAEGTTPTIGAQVVNIGATGTPFSVQPTSIKSLDGENNVSASTGDVEELKYFADL
jgi:hypothetical protein